jgi:tetratricopeptide (TPR) repeat protein
MTLVASLLRQIENQNLSVHSRAELCCELAKEFENKGEYEEARKVLSGLWPGIGERPDIEGLEPISAAEVLLRVGVLTGAIGSKNQIADSQETAKNLISESLRIFEARHYRKKVAEAQTELALCYWRRGEYNEARDLLNETLDHLTSDSELKAKAVLRLAIVEQETARYLQALRLLKKQASLFDKIHNHAVKGGYHVVLGNLLENLWESERHGEYLDRALVEYAAASYHFEEAKHRCYRANVENNLGFLYYKINRCKEAHEHLDKARRVLSSLKDKVTIAEVDETRACVFLKERRYVEAEQVAFSAVRALQKGRQSKLAEALITHGRALVGLGNYVAALDTFRRAIAFAEHTGNLNRAADAALAAFQEMGDHLTTSEVDRIASGRKFTDAKQVLEHDAIKRALDDANGSITYAARSLGMPHQSLNYMLHTRHKDLLKKRIPAKRRTRKK